MCPVHWIPTMDHVCPACDESLRKPAPPPKPVCGTCGGIGELEGGRGEPPRVDCPECVTPRK